MAEKRQHKRLRRRHNVKFGESGFTHSGLTHDVSSTGMFLVSNQLFPLKTRLHIQMFLDTQRFLSFEAEVRRQRVIPVELRSVEKGGMGLRLLTPTELMRELMDGGRTRITLTYPSLAAFQGAFERELKRGQMQLRTQRPLPPGTKVILDIVLPFASGLVEIEAAVAPSAPGVPEGTATVQFESPESVPSLASFLKPSP